MLWNFFLFVFTLYTFGQRTPDALVAVMTLEEKVGQMVQVERGDLEDGDIAKYYLGSVLSGGGSVPEAEPGESAPESWVRLLNSYLNETDQTRLKIPIIYGMDAVHGVNNVVGSTVFPHNINYGATTVGNEELGKKNVREEGQAVLEEVRALGVPWTFSPVLADPQNIHWGRTYEGYSQNISIPTILGPEFIKAIQSTGEVSACMKHYIGEGYATDGINRGDAILTDDEVRGILAPYAASVKAGAWTLMPSFTSINGLKCSENKFILQTLLKDELGFDGFTISDWDAVSMLQTGTYKEKIARCVNAGLDMIMATTDGDDPDFDENDENWSNKAHWVDTYELLIENVNDGNISMSRIDDAVRRILRVKQRVGLLNDTIVYKAGKIGTFHDVARKHAADSLVLLKNKNLILSKLGSYTNFLVVGQGADDVGMQCGGWTRSWQGEHGNDVVPGTSILAGLKAVPGKNFVYSENGTVDPTGNPTWDAVIVVVGEDPYAEWFGDRKGNITLRERDIEVLQNVNNLVKPDSDGPAIPVIAILISGRPLHLGSNLDNWDALIAAFLPGSEGGPGIADVLFGERDFVAKTPYTWASYNDGAIVFPYGFGLTKTTGEVDRTPENLLSLMTLEEKVGQMIQVERGELQPGDIAKYTLGSVLSGGGSVPTAAPGQTAQESWVELLNSYLAETSQTRLKIPIIYGMDAVHGVNNVVGSTVFPHNINYGATAVGNEAEGILNVQEEGKAVQEEVHALGVPWTFAPVLADPQNIHWGRTYEGYSENISIPTLLAPEFIKAVQSTGEVSACMKHYIGEGYATEGKNRGDAILTDDQVREILKPYAASVKAGAWTLMPSFTSINGLKCTENQFILQTLLKDELKFDGFTVSDWDAVSMLPNGTYKEKIARCINAGLDMIMATVDGDDPHEPVPRLHWIDTYNLLLENVKEGVINITRIDDAVLRILRIKERVGLLQDNIVLTPRPIGTNHHFARKHAAESFVLLKNKDETLNKIQSYTNFFVAGQGADDVGMQCGGWTQSWQGGHGHIVPGTSILEGLRSIDGKNFVYSKNGLNNFTKATYDAAIVVVGEEPYAEWFGDRKGNISLSDDDLATLQNVYSLKIPTIVIVLSGRPLHLGDEVDKWDALIAAFLPGSEAGPAIADVLFRGKNFVAKLPYKWAKYDGGAIVYDYGFGLTKASVANSGTKDSEDNAKRNKLILILAIVGVALLAIVTIILIGVCCLVLRSSSNDYRPINN